MTDHELPLTGRALDATCRELAAVRAERDALAEKVREAEEYRDRAEDELGQMYWHLTNGQLSKPYTFANVQAVIDDAITATCDEHAREVTHERDALRAALMQVRDCHVPPADLNDEMALSVIDAALATQEADRG